MKKIKAAEQGISRFVTSAEGLGKELGLFLYQLPPRWHANPERLEHFISYLPRDHQAAFEFRDPSWFQPATLATLNRILSVAGCALAIAIGGPCPTPLDAPPIRPFLYLRFHHVSHEIGLSDDELPFWATRLSKDAAEGRAAYVYFNNDAYRHAVNDAHRLREMLGAAAVSPH